MGLEAVRGKLEGSEETPRSVSKLSRSALRQATVWYCWEYGSANILSGESTGRPLARRVLIIEDHEDSRTVLHRLILTRGYEVRSVSSVAEAIRELGWGPHAIVLDLMLPDQDGLDLLPHLPGGGDGPKVGILSAVAPAEVAERVPSSIPYFLKPLDYRLLLDWLDRVLAGEVWAASVSAKTDLLVQETHLIQNESADLARHLSQPNDP